MAGKKKKKTGVVRVKADPARQAAFEKLFAVMKTSKREEMSGFDAYYEALGELLDRELYVYDGHDTAEAFLAANVKLKPRTAWRYIRVARLASPEEEERYTPTVIDAVIAYIEALTGGAVKEKLPIKLDALRVPVERDGETKKLLLKDVTLAEIQTATKTIALKGKAGRKRASPAEATIVAALSKIASLTGTTVSVSNGELRLGRIPLAALGQLATALSRVKLASPGAKATKAPARKKPGR